MKTIKITIVTVSVFWQMNFNYQDAKQVNSNPEKHLYKFLNQ